MIVKEETTAVRDATRYTPSLAYGIAGLPEKDFAMSGQFHGTPAGFDMDDFRVKVGENDLLGEFDANLEGKPHIVGYLSSGNYGHHLGSAVGMGYVKSPDGGPIDLDWIRSGSYEIEVACERVRAEASLRAFYDPKSERVKV